jgi:hypothetical protein
MRRRMMMSKISGNSSELPSEYIRLDYIVSTGAQYIDTEYIPNNNTSVEIQFLFDVVGDGQNRGVFGTRAAATSKSFCLISSNSAQLFSGYGTTNTNTYLRFNANTIYTVKKQKNITIMDDEIITTASNQIFTCPYALVLFAVRNGSKIPTFNSSMNLYYCKIWDGDTLVREFIPCQRISDNTVGLYDKVYGVFYENKGTGEFLGG